MLVGHRLVEPGSRAERHRNDAAVFVAGDEDERHTPRAQHFGDGKAHLAVEVDVQDRPVERLALRQFEAALQPARRTDDLAAPVLEQNLGNFRLQQVVLDNQDLKPFQPRRQHDRCSLPVSGPTIGTTIRGGFGCSLERRAVSRYDKAMTDLLDQGAAAISSAVRAGKTSARDVAEAAIARVEAKNKAITAIVDFDPAEARAAADAVDGRCKQGFDGPILGVPYTVKDTTWVQGRRVTNGSLLWKDFKPPRDAVAVERLKAAGGVFLGMTNTPEMAAKGHTENKVYGPSRHPKNPALTPGGSSGGAAAALAAGFTPIALGTDGGGSGRRPASHCGVVGLKTSAGAIPSPFGFGGAYGPLYGVTAPMGRSVADAKVAFEVMAGPDPRDPHSVALLDVPPPSSPRIALSPRLGLDVAVDPDVMMAFKAAIARLRAAGWRIEEADVAWPEGTSETAFSAVNQAASALLHGEHHAKDKDLFGDNVAGLIERGRSVPGTDVVAAFRFADACARAVAQFFTAYDYLLTPTTACVSWPVEQVYPQVIENREVGPRGHAAFTPLFNLALVPGISIPCGSGRDGLPVGLQIVAPRLHDRPLLAMAQRAEAALA